MKIKLIFALLIAHAAAAQTPTVTGVANGFSFTPSLSPGVLAAVIGTNFGTDKTALTVTIGGKQAFLIFAANTQLNVQIPVELQPGATTLVVTRSGAASTPFNITLAAYSPALTAAQDGKTVALLDAISNKPVTTVNPGEIVVAFAVGLGPTNPPAVTGVPAPAGLAPCVTTPQLTLGGVSITPIYAGLSPGTVGQYQINLKIPTVPAGTQPLVLTIGGVSSAPLNVNVAAATPAVPPSGSFGFLTSFSFSDDPSSHNGASILGVMNFDGAGALTGSYTFQLGAFDPQPAQTLTGTLTGTYSSHPDGTGTVSITADNGTTFTFAMVITDGGKGLQLVATDCGGGCSIGGTTVISGAARTASTGPLKGAYGFQLSNSPIPAGTIGVMSFDGAGGVTVSFTSVGVTGTRGQPDVSNGTLTGSYSTNPDGSGSMKLTAGSFSFVVTDGGSGLLLLLTDGAQGSVVSSGTARLQ